MAAVAGWPALMVAAVLLLPGASDTATVPTVGFVPTYLSIFLVILVFGGPLGEEPGWRGFALPRLQQRLGPLGGALVVGALHGFWHLPVYLLVPGYNGAPPDLPGVGVAFLVFVVGVMAGSVVTAWIFNNTRGSLLIAILHHASSACGTTGPGASPSHQPGSAGTIPACADQRGSCPWRGHPHPTPTCLRRRLPRHSSVSTQPQREPHRVRRNRARHPALLAEFGLDPENP